MSGPAVSSHQRLRRIAIAIMAWLGAARNDESRRLSVTTIAGTGRDGVF